MPFPTGRMRAPNAALLRSLCAWGLYALVQFTGAPSQGLPQALSAWSASGQFLIQELAIPSSIGAAGLESDTNFVRLEPTLLAISCERIKRNLWRELGATDPWRGRIFLAIYPARSAQDPVTITSEKFRDGWQYRLDLPNVVERSRCVRGVVQALLLEMANRRAEQHSAEIPLWLTEGMARQLRLSAESEIILQPPRARPGGMSLASTFVDATRKDPLTRAHDELRSGPLLSFQELSWPSPEQASGAGAERYCSSAQLFLNELLRLPDGKACLRAMLAELPSHYNWQFAFLHAFNPWFQRPLDVEKWWTLHLVHFTGRELAQTWPMDESWQKLDEIIRSPIEVRASTNDLPLHIDVRLQTIIEQAAPERQKQLLAVRIRALELTRPRLARELVPLVDDYQRVLVAYLQKTEQPGFTLPFRRKAARRQIAQETIRQLDDLDAKRSNLRPERFSYPAIQANSRGEARH